MYGDFVLGTMQSVLPEGKHFYPVGLLQSLMSSTEHLSP